MSVTVKDLLVCSWHLWLSLFGIPSNINCAKCRIYGVNSFEKEEIASQTTIPTTFTECPADPGAACPPFPAHQENSRSSAWSTLQSSELVNSSEHLSVLNTGFECLRWEIDVSRAVTAENSLPVPKSN